jgi:tetratricopeptide (TPR) repeat protein
MYNLGSSTSSPASTREGIKVLQEYIATACKAVPAEAHIFLANALVERKRYQDALPQIDLALSKAKAPNQSWIEMKLAVSYEMKDYKACAQSLVQLIGLAPTKPEYWKQLSSMFFEMKSDLEAVAVLSLAERQGFIEKPNERRNLYNVYMMLELPYKAGTLLQDSIEKGKMPADEANLEAVADAWINAREAGRAEATLKKLASMSEKGDYLFKLGAMYGDNEQWKDSREALQKAVQKGGIKRMGEAWMRLAVAEYSLKNVDGAVAALRKAATFDETRKQASEWLRHLTGQTLASSHRRASRAARPGRERDIDHVRVCKTSVRFQHLHRARGRARSPRDAVDLGAQLQEVCKRGLVEPQVLCQCARTARHVGIRFTRDVGGNSGLAGRHDDFDHLGLVGRIEDPTLCLDIRGDVPDE